MAQKSTDLGPSIRMVAFASAIGATIEWYDFFLYGVVTPLVFNKLFFPNYDAVVGTLLAYTTFFVGFISRPIGGIIFGHYGDRIGRKGVLVLTLMIMGVATFLIGLLPTYASVGIWAPALLLFLRVFQGIGIGGEWAARSLWRLNTRPKVDADSTAAGRKSACQRACFLVRGPWLCFLFFQIPHFWNGAGAWPFLSARFSLQSVFTLD
jgi:MFS family permease